MTGLFCVQLLAESDTGTVITFIVALLYGAFWLIRKLAANKEQQRQIADKERDHGDASDQDEKDEESYVAGKDQVRRFLETLGMQAEAKPERPPQPPRPPTADAPGRPPQRRLQAEPEPPALAAAPLAPEPPPTPRPQVRPAKRHAPPPEPEEKYVFGSPSAKPDHPETPLTSVAHRHVPEAELPQPAEAASPADLLAFPHLPPLQRAIVLCDILGRRPGTPGRSRR